MKVAVVGLGVAGSMTAWRLAQAGHEVVGFEQFALDHDRGSSFGDSRIIRRAYPDAVYSAMMDAAYPLWAELQKRFSGDEIFAPRGGLFFAPRDHPDMAATAAALTSTGAPFETLTAAECAKRFPQFKFGSEEVAIYDPGMGSLRASLAVRAAAQLGRGCGAILHENCALNRFETTRDGRLKVVAEGGVETTVDKLVLTVGPWLAPVLQGCGGPILPVKVVRKIYLHLMPREAGDSFSPAHFPVWIDAASSFYGFPQIGSAAGIKIALHDGGELTTPEAADRSLGSAEREALVRYATNRFPDLGEEVSYEKVCLYTVTPDEDFIIDFLPEMPNILLMSACSGHGFKFGPLLGQIAADLLQGNRPPCNLSRFALNRF